MNMKFEHAPGGAMAIHAKVPNQLVFKADGTLESATKPDLKTASPETLATVGTVREMNRMPLFFQGIHNGTREGLQRVYKGCATPNDAIQISALTHPELVKAVLRGDVATCDEAAFQADPYKRGMWSRGTAYLDGAGKPQGWVRTPDLNQAMPDSLPPPFARGGADSKVGSTGKDTMRNIVGEIGLAYGVIGGSFYEKLKQGIGISFSGPSNNYGYVGFDASRVLPAGHVTDSLTGEFAPWHIYGVSYSITSNGVFNEGAIDAEQVMGEVLLDRARIAKLEDDGGLLQITGPATLTGSDNKLVMVGIVPGIKLQKGDVIQIAGAGEVNAKLRTVESIVNNDELILNYEHCGVRGNGPLKLVDFTGQCTVTRIAKWFNAAEGLGQEWVGVDAIRTVGTVYQNTTNRVIALSFAKQYIGLKYIYVNSRPVAFGQDVSSELSLLSASIPSGANYSMNGSGTSTGTSYISERR